MTMVDDEQLRALIGDAAGHFEIPEGGAARVLSAAAPDRRPVALDPGEALDRQRAPRPRRRVLLAAAVVVALAGGVALIEAGPGGTPSRSTVSAARSPGGKASSGHVPGSSASGPAFGTSNAAAGSTPQAAGGAQAPSGAPSAVKPAPLPAGIVGQSAKVEATGAVALAIGNGSLDQVVTKLTNLAVAAGGFVAKSQLQVGAAGGPDPSYGTLVLQVPAPSFGGVLTQVQGVATVTSVTSTSTDVTGQYVDLQARISALQASRQQYLTILSKAETIGDILAVQSQLDTIQSEIEQLQGQLNVLDSQTAYGTLTVSLSGSGHRPVPPPPPRSGLSSAWHDSVGGFVAGVEWLIRMAGPTLFVLLMVAALTIAARWAWRFSRRRLL